MFQKYADFSLETELAGKNGEGRFDYTEIAQPALFALQVGITRMLLHQGLRPTSVAGHSVGEIAAAWAPAFFPCPMPSRSSITAANFREKPKAGGK